MRNNQNEIYIPKRKIKKNRYLEAKKLNEEYESILDIWGSSNGDDEKTRKIKAREIMKSNPELSLYRSVLTTEPSAKEDEIAEGFRYWMMKENGTLPVKQKTEVKDILSIINPIVETLATEQEVDSAEMFLPKVSLTKDIIMLAAKDKEEATGKKQKVTFGTRVAKFFGF